MKRFLLILAFLMTVARLPAQTNAPVRLALVSDTADATAVADVLTAQLSGDPGLQLLERDQIAKVYHEQGLSAANTDFIKLGQLLGADGLLLLQASRTAAQMGGGTMTLHARLIAVKAGVVLAAEKFSWPEKQGPVEWSAAYARHLDGFLPKLRVRQQDALPLSLVNLRSTVNSAEAGETERQLKSLTTERLSEEPRLFVLERQRMELLSDEKDLKTDESAFWNGSYLLEGVVDQNGYSQDTITIDARLTPPKGGAPLLLAVSGSRTNLPDVVNQLAIKVEAALKIQPAAPAWNAADEAAQYLEEARWALRWNLYAEAQAAAESAWALGRKDLACELVRIKACLQELSAETVKYQNGQSSISSGFDANGNPLGPTPSDARVQRLIAGIYAQHHLARITKITTQPGSREVSYIYPDKSPEVADIALARHALELYEQFDRTSPDGEPKILWRGKGWNDWRNSDWYQAGIDDLVAASRVLQSFNFAPAAQGPVADQLAGLRAEARTVAGLIEQAPTVHDSYFVGDRMVSHDELSFTIEEHPNIFRVETDWGCFWQETPEDALAGYRHLMASPVFCYVHHDLWYPGEAGTRLAGWNEADRQRLPAVWNHFLTELSNSTNVLWRMEAKALALADAQTDEEAKADRNGLVEIVRANLDELASNNVELAYSGWGLGRFPEMDAVGGEHSRIMEAREKEAKDLAEFEKKKAFLKNQAPFDSHEFSRQMMFGYSDFSKAQTRELQALLTAYQTNLDAHYVVDPSTPGIPQRLADFQISSAEDQINRRLNTPEKAAPKPVPALPTTTAVAPANQPGPAPRSNLPKPAVHAPAEIVTNIVTVDKFLPVPLAGLPGSHISALTFTAHHWTEGKLVLDFKYGAFLYTTNAQGQWLSTRNATLSGIAILDPAAERWRVASCPEASIAFQSRFYHRTTLLHYELFNSDGGEIRKYDFNRKKWETLPVSSGENFQLFVVDDRLYAANGTMIFEITDGGKSSRILASTRRRPAASVLDTQDLGAPALFAGPNDSLRVSTQDKVFTSTGNDWREDSAAPSSFSPPAIFPDGVLFRDSGSLCRLTTQATAPELCLGSKSSPRTGLPAAAPAGASPAKSFWKLPPRFFLANLPAALGRSNLFLLAGHSDIKQIVNDRHEVVAEKVIGRDGCNGFLLCYSPDLPQPQKVFLNFDAPAGRPPLGGVNPDSSSMFTMLPPALLVFAGENLLFASENSGMVMPMATKDSGEGQSAGVWMLRAARLDSIIAEQRQAQADQIAQASVTEAQAQKNLLAKYDQNHNGIIDPDEREEALDDPAFIAAELNTIDADHNGWLEAPELAWFDANQNKILEPKEQAGIDLAQHLLAQKLFDQFDKNEKGWLQRQDYNELIEATLNLNANADLSLQFARADENHDGQVDLGELEGLLKRRTQLSLRRRGTGPPVFMMQMNRTPGNDSGQAFKSALESYWQNPNGAPDRQPMGADFGFPGWHPAPAAQPAPISPQVRAEMEQFQKNFLQKYDHNHNGVLDPDERSEARDDPDYSHYMINGLRLQPPAAPANSP